MRAGDGGSAFVKRLIGLPGERVSERDGVVYVDGRRLGEPYLDPASRDHQTGSWPTIPPGHYFFMGDNRAHSCDSRTWGAVPRGSPGRPGPVYLLAAEPDHRSLGLDDRHPGGDPSEQVAIRRCVAVERAA